ncbi:hypothetical protein AMATHDRAFT_50152 [Amanita thiersii Skay4041]|uniref:Uncharacterized protein n=1 Tax=Amanita thiersii Skay4041 TaxID=703135 RepID=A0A2A9NC38_9AGAR|nr:hypothetical protein AMATHDRAFT_50152 [Amanita thiersii Skay4041]
MNSSDGISFDDAAFAAEKLEQCDKDSNSSDGQDHRPGGPPPATPAQQRGFARLPNGPEPPIFPRLSNQSHFYSPRSSQAADMFRKPFQGSHAQQQQPFFNLLNTINARVGSSRKSDRPKVASTTPKRGLPIQHVPAQSQSQVNAGSRAYTTSRQQSDQEKSMFFKNILQEESDSKRWREPQMTPDSIDPSLDLDELALKVLKENKSLRLELANAHNTAQNLSREIESLRADNMAIHDHKSEGEKQLESLKAEMSCVSKDLASTRTELLSVKDTLNSTQRNLHATSSEMNAYKDQNSTVTYEKQELERQYENLQSKLDTAKKGLKEAKEKLNYSSLYASFTDLKKSYEEFRPVIRDALVDIAEMKTMVNLALKVESTSNVEEPAQASRMREVLNELQESLASSYRTNDMLRDKLHLHLSQIVDLNERIKELESEKHELVLASQKQQESAAQNFGAKVEELVEHLLKREQELGTAVGESEALKKQLGTAENKISELQRTIDANSLKINTLLKYQEQCAKAEAENKSLNKLLAEKEAQLEVAEQTASGNLKSFESAERDAEDLRLKLMEAESSIKGLNEQLQQLQTQLVESREAVIRAEATAETNRLVTDKDRQAVKELESQLSEFKQREVSRNAEYQAMETRIKKVRKELEDKETTLNQKVLQLTVLEERLEAQAVTLRLSKEQCGDLQETNNALRMEILTLQQQIAAHQNTLEQLRVAKERLDKANSEYLEFSPEKTVTDKPIDYAKSTSNKYVIQSLQGRLDTEIIELRHASDKKRELENRLKSVETQLSAFSKARMEKVAQDMSLLSAEREKSRKHEKDLSDTRKSLSVTEQERYQAENRAAVLQERFDTQSLAFKVVTEQLEKIQVGLIRNASSNLKGQLESLKERLKGEMSVLREQNTALQNSLNQARQDAATQRSLMDDRLLKQERDSERLLEVQEKRALAAEKEAVQANRIAEMAKRELDECVHKQEASRLCLSTVEKELDEVRTSLQMAVVEADNVKSEHEEKAREQLALLEKLSGMEVQIANLTETNQQLSKKRKTLRDRYESGDLVKWHSCYRRLEAKSFLCVQSEDERSFVHFIVATTQSIHEKDLLDKANELKLVHHHFIYASLLMIMANSTKVKSLESTIARKLREKATGPEPKPLVNLNLWMSSSPPDALNKVPITAAEPLHMTSVTSAPVTLEEASVEKRTAEVPTSAMKPSRCENQMDEDDSPTFSQLSQLDSGDDDIPLSELTRLSPTPVHTATSGKDKKLFKKKINPGDANV